MKPETVDRLMDFTYHALGFLIVLLSSAIAVALATAVIYWITIHTP